MISFRKLVLLIKKLAEEYNQTLTIMRKTNLYIFMRLHPQSWIWEYMALLKAVNNGFSVYLEVVGSFAILHAYNG